MRISTAIQDARRKIEGNAPHLENHDDCLKGILDILQAMNDQSDGVSSDELKAALSRVCDDAERWNAKFAMDDPSGYDSITIVRRLYRVKSAL